MALIPGGLSPKDLGDLLRQARENAKITQAAAAAALDVARTTLVAMEQGQRRPRVDELQKLAVLYGQGGDSRPPARPPHADRGA